jgi:flagellar motor switch protein FliN/FliY
VPDPLLSATPSWLAENWAAQLTRAVESMAGEAPEVAFAVHELSSGDLETGPDKVCWWEQTFSLGTDSLIWIGAAPATWREIGNRVLRNAGVEEEDVETVRGTYLEILSQALSGLAGAVSARVHKEVSCSGGRESPPPSAAVAGYSFDLTFGEAAVPVLAAFNASWSSLSDSAPPEDSREADRAAAARPASVAVFKPNSIDLLLDVELPVSVSFGRAQIALKDVIKLTTGSIVELNRAVSEPVEVIVNNCVIARGEVVVVEGNFGIRIKEVISRQERLRTLN